MYNSFKLLALPLLLSGNPALAQWSPCAKDSTIVTYSQLASNALQVVADLQGGAYYIWYSGDANQIQFRAHGQHVNREGIRLWGDEGIPLEPSGGNQTSVQCLPDGVGGLLVFWIESREGNGLNDLFGQRLSPNGQRLWQPGGLHFSDCIDFYRYPVARLSDGKIATIHQVETGAGITTYLRRFEPDGSPEVELLLEEKHSTNYPVRLIADDQGGVFTLWQNDTIKLQYLDEAGALWPAAVKIIPDNAAGGSFPAAYACAAGSDGVFVAWCGYNAATQFCDLQAQRFDRQAQPGWPQPYIVVPVFGFNFDHMTPARDGGFYFFALNAVHKIGPSGTLQWRTELPPNTNTGVMPYFIETENGSLLAAFSANGLVLFDASGNIAWNQTGNPPQGGAFGLGGICRTTDRYFFTAQLDPATGASSPVLVRRLDDTGQPVGTLSDFAGPIAGPDSVYFDTPFSLEAQPVAGTVIDWFYAPHFSLGFSRVPEEAFGPDKNALGVDGIFYDFYTYAVVQLGRNCLDSTGIDTVHVRPVLPEGDFTKSDSPLVLRPTLVGMELFVATTFDKPYPVELWVTDISGRLVDFVEFQVDSGNFFGLYPTDDLRHGLYFFSMRVGEKSAYKKFVKLKD